MELAPDRTVKTSTYECHDRNPLIRSTLRENNLKPTGAVLIGFGQVGQPQHFPVSRETPPFAGFSGWAMWKGPDGRKRCSLQALWVQIIGAMAEFGRSRRSLDARRIASMRG